MLFYIIFLVFISVVFLLGYFFPDKDKLLSFVVLVTIILIGGLRYGVGGDYNSYVSWYLYKTRDDDLEFGFVAIMELFRHFNLSPQVLFFLFSFFTYLFIYLGIKKYTIHVNTALLFYILIPTLFLTSLNLVRQSFSVSISFYAFYYLLNKRYLVFSILMLIGISIHNTCLIPLIAFIFVFKFVDEIKKKHLLILLIVSFFMAMLDCVRIFAAFFENTRYAFYFSNEQIPVNFFKIIILNCLSLLILFFYYDKLKIVSTYQKYLLVLYFLSVVLINILSPFNDLSRIYTYFRVFEIIIVTDLIFLETNRKRVFLFSFFSFFYLSTFLIALKKDSEIQSQNRPKFTPYNNILWSFNKLKTN